LTLNITVVSKNIAYQSSDFRLSTWDPVASAYRAFDSPADKQMPVFAYGWVATVCFTGVGRSRSLDTSAWLSDQIRRLQPTADFNELISALRGFETELQWVPRRDKRHTFTIVSFAGGRTELALVSNFEYLSGVREQAPSDRLFVTSRTVTRPLVIATGQREALAKHDRRFLLRSIPRVPTPPPEHVTPANLGEYQLSVRVGPEPSGLQMLQRLANVNARSAASPSAAMTVSRDCVVSALQSDGQAWFYPAGIPETQDYIPEFAFHRLGSFQQMRQQGNFTRKVNANGNPEPIRLTQIMANRRTNPDALVVALVLSGVEERNQ
jgi:hypothetical protein